jgi:4-amino-4-deoxy-L-arabinose transferase-like glycosyltransferase
MTTLAPDIERVAAAPSVVDRFAASRAGRWTIERVPLIAVLTLQIVLSYRLHNSAFQDEALYLYAGHREIGWLFHHIPTFDNYSTYFSGAPFLYPIVGAAVDGLFGLEGARALSLLCMLGATSLVWATSRLLYGRHAAACAAALFAVAAPTFFLGRFATYDAPALFLLALAFWLVVRTARRPAWWVLLAVPVAALAVGTKYAALLYVPTIACVALLAGRFGGAARDGTTDARPRTWLAAAGRGLLFTVSLVALLAAWLRLLGPAFLHGIDMTTTNRAAGGDALLLIVERSAEYGAGVFALAVIGVAVDLARARAVGVARSSLVARGLLSAALATAALLAPLYQMHLHTLTSLHKHVGFGLVFAAPIAGVALAALLRAGARDPRRLGIALLACLGLTAAALNQSSAMYRQWPNASAMVSAIRTQIRPVTGRYLAEESEVPRYYTADITYRLGQIEPFQWYGTYFFFYTDLSGNQLSGVPAYRQAIADRYFDIIILRYGPTAPIDLQIDAQLKAQHGYTLIAVVPADSSYGTGNYYIWRAEH